MMQISAISSAARAMCSPACRVAIPARSPPGRRSASASTKAAKTQ